MTTVEKESITKLIGEFDKNLTEMSNMYEGMANREALNVLKKAMRLLGQETPSKKDMADLASEYASVIRYEQQSSDHDQIQRQFANKFREVYYIRAEDPKTE